MVSEGKRLQREKKERERRKNKPSFFSDNPASHLSKCINTETRCQIEGVEQRERK